MVAPIGWTDDQALTTLSTSSSIGAIDMIPATVSAFAIAAAPALLVLSFLAMVGVIVASLADAEPGGLVPRTRPGS
jgi:hypothetical protein